MVAIEQFRQLELKVAKVLEVKVHPDAERLLVLTVDVGGVRKQIVAGVARHYSPPELLDRLIVVVDNLQPAVIRGVTSDGMLLAAQDANGLSLIVPDRPVAIGSAIH